MSTATLPAWPKTPAPYATTTEPASTCACTKTAALTVQRGATLSTKLTLTITDNAVTSPVDITGSEFQFTAKPTQDTPDDDPATVKIDWFETSLAAGGTPNSQLGITWLQIPADTTAGMLDVSYVMQVRMVSPSGVVTPLVGGSLTVTEPPASARYT